MRRTTASGLAVVAVATAAAFAVGSPAFADPTWTVTPGGATTATSQNTTVKDTATGTTLTCASSTVSASTQGGSGLSGTAIATVSSVTVSGCKGPLGISFGGTVSSLTAALNAISYANGVTTGTLSGISGNASGFLCSASVAGPSATTPGTVEGTYTNSTHTLTVTGGDLHIWNVWGCFGLIQSGDPLSISASYVLSPAQTITSP
jgi:hypothetical protein